MAAHHHGPFWPQKMEFLDAPWPGMAPGWCIKVSSTSFPMLGVYFESFSPFQVVFFLYYGILLLWLFFTQKTLIFGPTWTWNCTWMVHKSVQHTFSHWLRCVLSHFPVSRWIFGLIWQPTIMVHFDPKNGYFWMPPDLEWYLERGWMASSHLPIHVSKLLVHFQPKIHITVVVRARNLTK